MKKLCGLIILATLFLLNSSLKAQNCNITLTSAVGTDEQIICFNTAITNITYTNSLSATGVSVTGLPAGVNYAFVPPRDLIIYGTPGVIGTFNYTLTYLGVICADSTRTGKITINPRPTATASPSSQAILSGSVINSIILSGNVTGTTFTWTRDNTGTVTGIGGSGSGTVISGTLTNTTCSPIYVTFFITPTANGCFGPTTNATVLVDPTTNAIATPSSQAICSGTAINDIGLTSSTGGTSFAWSRNNTGSVTGIAASGTGTPISGILTNTTFAPVTVTFTITSTLNGCVGPATTAAVLVNPTSNVVATPLSQTICSGSAITPIVLSGNVGGTVYNWTRDNTGTVSGIGNSGSGNISGALINTSSAPITVKFTITPSFTNGGITCAGTAVTATVLVNPTPNTIPTPATQSICSGNTITPIVLSGDVVGTVYSWTRNNTGAVTGIAASGSGTQIIGALTNTGFAPVTVTFTIIPTANGCTGSTTTATVLVNPTPNVTASTASQTICSGANLVPIDLTSSTNGTTYTWTRDNTTTVTGMGASGGGTPVNGSLTSTVNVPVTVTFTITPAANGCTGTTTTAAVLVNPLPNAIATPSSQTTCSGSPIVNIALTGILSGTTFTWSRDNTGSVTGIAGSGAGTQISGTLTNTTFSPVPVTFTVTPLANGCTGPTTSVTVLVNPTPNAMAIPLSQTICSGNGITPIALSSNVVGTVYNWTRNNTVAVTGIGNSGSGNISGILQNNSGTLQLVTFTITPLTTNGGATCTGSPVTASVLVNPGPDVLATPSSQTICSGNAITAIVLSGSLSGTFFNWVRDNTSTVTGIASSGTGNIIGSLLNVTSTLQIVTFTITPKRIVGNDTCTGPSTTATVLVNPGPNVVATPLSQTICSGSAITPIVLSGNVGGTVYNWTRDNTGTVSGIGNSGSGNISGSLQNNSSAPQLVTFTITPTSTTGGATCTGLSITASVLIIPGPGVIATPSTQSICSGNIITPIALSSNLAGTIFSWTRDNTAIVTGIAASGVGSTINGSLTSAAFAATTVTFTITPSLNGCSGLTTTATVLVNSAPSAVATPSSQSVCSGSAITNIVLSGSTLGTIFTWTRDNTVTVTGIAASGSGALISGILTNTTFAPITVSFTITPTVNGCAGQTSIVTVLVNPAPNAIATPLTQTMCSGATLTPIVLSSNISATTYTWTRDNATTVTGMGVSGGGTPITGSLTSTTGTPVMVTFTITPSYTNSGTTCTGTPIFATILVTPSPIAISLPAAQSTCSGAPISAINLSSNIPGTNYTWTRNNPAVSGIPLSGTGNNISGPLFNPGNTSATVTFAITPTANGCIGPTAYATVQVSPIPVSNPIPNYFHCNRDSVPGYYFSSSSPDSIFTWTCNRSIGFGTSGAGFISSFIATNTDTVPKVATVTVSIFASSAMCKGLDRSFTVTVNPSPPKPNFNWPKLNNDILCKGSDNINFNIIAPAAGVAYKWSASSTNVNIRDTKNPNTVISFPETGTYSIKVVATNIYGCSDSVSQTVNVGTAPGISVRRILIKQPGSVMIYPDNSMNADTGYQWGYDSLIKPGLNPIYSAPKSFPGQIYQFLIPEKRVIDAVTNKLDTVKYAFWVLLRKGNCYTRVYYNGPYANFRSIETPVELTSVQLKVVPNPNNGIFTIALSGNIYGSMNMKIYNALGQPVFSNEFTKTIPEVYERFVTGNLPDGLYYLEIIGSDLNKAVTRFIIKH